MNGNGGPRGEEGAALVAVLVVSLLVGSLAAGCWHYTHLRLAAARARLAEAQAWWIARGAVRVAASWFEADERGALVPPPPLAALDRNRRRIDPDGDGRGPLWSAAPDPRQRVRYHETGRAPFRPPDGPAWEDRFVGTAAGPDALLARDAEPARAVLAGLSAALDPGGGAEVVRIAWFGPRPGAAPGALATIEVVVERARPPWGTMAARIRAEAVRIDWKRPERALVVAGDAEFLGAATWRRGDSVIGGTLRTGGIVPGTWPGGIPWLGRDRPLRDDADGDGTADDADADGRADLEAWRALGGDVPDPWWRGRVGGGWPGIAESPPATCAPAIPFGPRASPSRSPVKDRERSGLLVGCGGPTPDPLPASWLRLARLGVRGTVHAVEEPGGSGMFRRDGEGSAKTPAELMPPSGALLGLARPGASGPLRLRLSGGRGALAVEGDLALEAVASRAYPDVPPAAVRDTTGDDRAGAIADDALDLAASGAGCRGWQVGPWRAGPQPTGPAASRCTPRDAAFRGVVAASGRITATGPLRVVGQVRAASIVLDGSAGEVEIVADGAADPLVTGRPGPPGAPRIVADRLRRP